VLVMYRVMNKILSLVNSLVPEIKTILLIYLSVRFGYPKACLQLDEVSMHKLEFLVAIALWHLLVEIRVRCQTFIHFLCIKDFLILNLFG